MIQKRTKKHIENGTILNVMHKEQVKEGDTFYISTGRVHAIGAGILLAEIQQTSNITYRIFDYNRVDSKTGETRELHNDLAIDVIDFNVYDTYKTDYKVDKDVSNKLVHSPYFKTNILSISSRVYKNYTSLDSFVIFMCVEGEANIYCSQENFYSVVKGETILLPACVNQITLESKNARLLEIYY